MKRRRKKVYQILSGRLGFLTLVNSMSDMKYFREEADYLDFTDEIIMSFEILKMDWCQVKIEWQMLKYIIAKKLTVAFPNVCIAFWIYLSILTTSCEGDYNEKSKKLFKVDSIGQEKLTNLALLSIEYDLMKTLNVDHIINCFAAMKHRKSI